MQKINVIVGLLVLNFCLSIFAAPQGSSDATTTVSPTDTTPSDSTPSVISPHPNSPADCEKQLKELSAKVQSLEKYKALAISFIEMVLKFVGERIDEDKSI